MRIFGAFIVLAASVFSGLIKCREAKMQEKLVAELISVLELIKNEIATRRTPLKSIFRLLKKSVKIPDMIVFTDEILNNMDRLGELSFSDIWSESINKNLTVLPDTVKNAVIELGMSLGRYDAEMQESAIDRCMTITSKEHEELLSGLRINGKMYMGLYSGVGAIIAIVLI